MRKITKLAISHFLKGIPFKQSNTEVIGTSLYLHGNEIARKAPSGELLITTAGWDSNTTKERLNGIPGVKINTAKGQLYLNGEPWDGEWKVIGDTLKLRILKAAQEFRLDIIEGYESDFGICIALSDLSEVNAEVVEYLLPPLFSTWPHFSEDESYPIPAQSGSPEDCYYSDTPKYRGRSLELRLSLLDHIISELQKCNN